MGELHDKKTSFVNPELYERIGQPSWVSIQLNIISLGLLKIVPDYFK
jgi:hypothetical protein